MQKHIYWLETEKGHYLSIGNRAPWDNFLIRVPKWVARLLNELF